MSLKNKLDETKLRSLRYGDNEPYIVVNVVDQSFDHKSNSLSDKALNLLPDNLNLLGNNINLRNTRPGAATIDTIRIGRFLTDPKYGPQFIAKQIGLQAMNINSNFGNGPINNQLYNPLNTLSQISLSGVGGHLKRSGLIPGEISDFLGDLDTYESIKLKETENQLVKFKNQLISPNLTEPDNTLILAKIKQNKTFSKILDFLGTTNNIYSYIGGPSSFMGIGTTSIKRDYNSLKDIYKNDGINLRGFTPSILDRSKIENINGFSNGTKIIYPILYGASIKALNLYPELNNIIDKDFQNGQTPLYLSQTGSNLPSGLFPSLQNIKSISNNPYTPYIYGSNKVQLSSSGSIKYDNKNGSTVTIKGNWYDQSREIRLGSGKQDLINLTPLFTTTGGHKDSIKINNKIFPIRDIIKFRIETIEDEIINGDKIIPQSTWMIFRAYLTDLSDNIQSDWAETKYTGRSEKLFTYNGFSRSINIGFKVAALSKEEMKPMYQKLNYLASGMAGKYDEGIMQGTFSRMTVGNYIDRQHGIINSLTFKISNETPWEIALDEPEGGDKLLILPHIIEVNMTFTPIGITVNGKNKIPQRTNNEDSWIAQDANRDINYISGGINEGSFKNYQPEHVKNMYANIATKNMNFLKL